MDVSELEVLERPHVSGTAGIEAAGAATNLEPSERIQRPVGVGAAAGAVAGIQDVSEKKGGVGRCRVQGTVTRWKGMIVYVHRG